MKSGMSLLCQENGHYFWYYISPAGNLYLRSLVGFTSEDEAKRHLEEYHLKKEI